MKSPPTINERKPIPIIETYRGVGIQDYQPPERIALVKSEIDTVMKFIPAKGEIQHDDLLLWVKDRSKSPESRLLAKAALKASIHESGEKAKRVPPHIKALSEEWLNAVTAGLGLLGGQSRTTYGGKLDPRPPAWAPQCERPLPREIPLPE